MYVTPEQIQQAGKANVEALLAVANAQFAAFEKLASINQRNRDRFDQDHPWGRKP